MDVKVVERSSKGFYTRSSRLKKEKENLFNLPQVIR
jgi:hypothetical protein